MFLQSVDCPDLQTYAIFGVTILFLVVQGAGQRVSAMYTLIPVVFGLGHGYVTLWTHCDISR